MVQEPPPDGRDASVSATSRSSTPIGPSGRLYELTHLAHGMPGLTPAKGLDLVEAATICLEERGHGIRAALTVDGDYSVQAAIERIQATDQMRLCYDNANEATEDGACAVAILVACDLSGYTVIRRSRTSTGVDYWLGNKNGFMFQAAALLEVSGIRNGNASQINARVREKETQVKQAPPGVPIFIVVVEFGSPRSRVVRRRNMKGIESFHEHAMELTDRALAARRTGNFEEAQRLFVRAFELEAEAANVLLERPDLEPSRSVLYRSAAALALDCGRLEDAKKLARIGLSGMPPPLMARQLREVLEHTTQSAADPALSMAEFDQRGPNIVRNQYNAEAAFAVLRTLPEAWTGVAGSILIESHVDEAQPWFERAVEAARATSTAASTTRASAAACTRWATACRAGPVRGGTALVRARRRGDAPGRRPRPRRPREPRPQPAPGGLLPVEPGPVRGGTALVRARRRGARQGDVHGRVDHESLGRSLHQVGDCLSSQGSSRRRSRGSSAPSRRHEQGDVHGRVDHESLGSSLHQVGYCLSSHGPVRRRRSPGSSAPSRRQNRATSTAASTTRASAAACTRWATACRARASSRRRSPGSSAPSRRQNRATSTAASTTRASAAACTRWATACRARAVRRGAAVVRARRRGQDARATSTAASTTRASAAACTRWVTACRARASSREAQPWFERAVAEARTGRRPRPRRPREPRPQPAPGGLLPVAARASSRRRSPGSSAPSRPRTGRHPRPRRPREPDGLDPLRRDLPPSSRP